MRGRRHGVAMEAAQRVVRGGLVSVPVGSAAGVAMRGWRHFRTDGCTCGAYALKRCIAVRMEGRAEAYALK